MLFLVDKHEIECDILGSTLLLLPDQESRPVYYELAFRSLPLPSRLGQVVAFDLLRPCRKRKKVIGTCF